MCSCMTNKKEKNKLVDSKKDEWISLFDGKQLRVGTTNGGELGHEGVKTVY